MRNISVLFNLILAKHKNNPNFNGHRNVDRLVQNTVRRYMLDMTGFLSEAGTFFQYLSHNFWVITFYSYAAKFNFKNFRNFVGVLHHFWIISKFPLIKNQYKMTKNLLTKSVAIFAMYFSTWLMMLTRTWITIVSVSTHLPESFLDKP